MSMEFTSKYTNIHGPRHEQVTQISKYQGVKIATEKKNVLFVLWIQWGFVKSKFYDMLLQKKMQVVSAISHPLTLRSLTEKMVLF